MNEFIYEASYQVEAGEPGTFSAFVNTTNKTDKGKDKVLVGGFDRSIKSSREKGKRIPVSWTHGYREDPMNIIGSISPDDIEEVDNRLVVKSGRLFLDKGNDRASYAYEMMKEGLVNEWSVGGGIVKGKRNKDGGIDIAEMDLKEISLCLSGMSETGTLTLKTNVQKDEAQDDVLEQAQITAVVNLLQPALDLMKGLQADEAAEAAGPAEDEAAEEDTESNTFGAVQGFVTAASSILCSLCYSEDMDSMMSQKAVDNSPWDGAAAMAAVASSSLSDSEKATAYDAICAGTKAGDPSLESSHALPHHAAPGDPCNAAGVRNSLSRLPQTQGLTNAAAAQKHLQDHLDNDVNKSYRLVEKDGRVLSAASMAKVQTALDALHALMDAALPPEPQASASESSSTDDLELRMRLLDL